MSGVRVNRRGSVDVDIGNTHVHVSGPGAPRTPQRPASSMLSDSQSSIKKLNKAVNELSATFETAAKTLERADEAHLYNSTTDPRLRPSLDVLAEKLSIENDLQNRDLLKRFKAYPSLTSGALAAKLTEKELKGDLSARLARSPYLSLSSPYLSNLDPSLRPYADKVLSERVLARTMGRELIDSDNRLQALEANRNFRNWLLEYSGMGSFTTTRMLEIAQKIEDLLEQIRQKDVAYAELLQAVQAKDASIKDLQEQTDVQEKTDKQRIDSLLKLHGDLQGKLKETRLAEEFVMVEAKKLTAKKRELRTLDDEIKIEIEGEKQRIAQLEITEVREKSDQKEKLRRQLADQRSQEQLISTKLGRARSDVEKQTQLNTMLQAEKADLEGQVAAEKALKVKTAEELDMALDIAKRLESSLEKELKCVQFWTTTTAKVATAVLGADAVSSTMESNLVPIGDKYQEAVATIAINDASIADLKRQLKKVRAFAIKEKEEILAETRKARMLTRDLVDEEHYEKELEHMVKAAVDKYKKVRQQLFENDARHKRVEAGLQARVTQARKELTLERAEINRAVENALTKVEQAKVMARNAKTIATVIDLDI